MRHTNIHLSDEQLERLDSRAREAAVSRAELVREPLDAALRGDFPMLDGLTPPFELEP